MATRDRDDKRSGFLAELPERYSNELLSSAKQLEFPEGHTLFEKDDLGDGCYWIREGIVKVCIASNVGEERILAILGAGAIVGELAMIDCLPRSATVVALSDCKAIFVERSAFTACLQENPELYHYLVKALVNRLRLADEDTAAASFLPVGARVARAVLKLTSYIGKPAGSGLVEIEPWLRQADIAAMAGVTRETVSRTFSEWKRQGLITDSTRYKLVLHKLRLEREAKGTAKEIK